jgi:hypothetical protein
MQSAGLYTGRIRKMPADVPSRGLSKFELVIKCRDRLLSLAMPSAPLTE